VEVGAGEEIFAEPVLLKDVALGDGVTAPLLDVEVRPPKPSAESNSSTTSCVMEVGIDVNEEAWLLEALYHIVREDDNNVPLLVVDTSLPNPKAERSPSTTSTGTVVGVGVGDMIPLLVRSTPDVEAFPLPRNDSSGPRSMMGSADEVGIAPELDAEAVWPPRNDNSDPKSMTGSKDETGVSPELVVEEAWPPRSDSSGPRSMRGSADELVVMTEVAAEEFVAPRRDNSGPRSTRGSLDEVAVAPEVNVKDVRAPPRNDISGSRSIRGLLVSERDVANVLSDTVGVRVGG
jgi:hypothetical protein